MNVQTIARQHEKSKAPISSLIMHADMKIGPDLASRVLSECFFEGQASRLKTGDLAIKRWAEFMRRGDWLDYSQITFCRIPDNRLFLVNGYHRLSGVILYGRDVWFNVIVMAVKSEADVASVFSLFDRPNGTRIRGDAQLLNAIGFSDDLGVPKSVARALYRSIILIKNGMKPIRDEDRESLLEFDILENRADEALLWKEEARAYAECVKGAKFEFRRKLMNPPLVAVALYTLRFQKLKASIFWAAVANNDGLRKGTPEHTLVEKLKSGRMSPGDSDNFVIPSLAWNAFFRDERLSSIRTASTKRLIIAGTPINGRDR